ncbi:MAG: DNA repair protein RecN [candidate division NC10 bacterium]|nr:DNA repair protein RecN [candidate division NC10 bacterium]
MLRELHIRNIALVEEVRAEFGPGLTALTGETGAGKSIVIDALTLALGARSDPDLIRTGAAEAAVEAAFDVSGIPAVAAALAEAGLTLPEDGLLILRRLLPREGKGRAYVNAQMVPAGTLRALGECLVDIHGQHQGRLLLSARRQLELLDAFGGTAEEAAAFREQFLAWETVRREQAALEGGAREQAARRDFLAFQVKEIDAARLEAGEEERLQAERLILANAERLFALVEEAYGLLEGEEGALLAGLKGAAGRLAEAARFDPDLKPLQESCAQAETLLKDVADEVRRYRSKVDFDPGRLETIETRLHAIERLKRKYGGSVAAILQVRAAAAADLATIEEAPERLKALAAEEARRFADLLEQGRRLSRRRQGAAARLRDGVLAELRELGMPKATFEVRFHRGPVEEGKPVPVRPTGLEEAEFLLSVNPGEELRPLAKVASGGELSRIMLALKGMLAEADETPTLIFDEVDSGIGGGMAEVVGRKLAAVGARRQVLCVTHLAQIAAMADAHHQVEKRTRGGRTETELSRLEGEYRVAELARMLGAAGDSDLPRKHAAAILERAGRLRKAGRRGGR